MKNFTLKYMPFPEIIRGQVFAFTSEVEGKYVILIDSTRTPAEQEKNLKHELAHIFLGHFEDSEKRPATELEKEAIALSDRMTNKDMEALLKWAI